MRARRHAWSEILQRERERRGTNLAGEALPTSESCRETAAPAEGGAAAPLFSPFSPFSGRFRLPRAKDTYHPDDIYICI